ncbi:hypothetical protein ON010_g18552 [Phytophthora cinnamomi]|nr:hypothetical protein ON010_g18552 [Phytophthora cinnamomi]
MNLDPEKTMQMEQISEQLSHEDVSFFEHIFRQIDIDNSGIMLRSELHDVRPQPTSVSRLPDCWQNDNDCGSKAIDLQEWVVLCGMLVTPPHDETDLLGAFNCLFPNEEDIPVVVFRTKMQRILENAYAHLPDSNQHEVSCYVDDIISALDPNNTECIEVQECIRILSAPYRAKPASPRSPTAEDVNTTTSEH